MKQNCQNPILPPNVHLMNHQWEEGVGGGTEEEEFLLYFKFDQLKIPLLQELKLLMQTLERNSWLQIWSS